VTKKQNGLSYYDDAENTRWLFITGIVILIMGIVTYIPRKVLTMMKKKRWIRWVLCMTPSVIIYVIGFVILFITNQPIPVVGQINYLGAWIAAVGAISILFPVLLLWNYDVKHNKDKNQ
jgi:branched-subunit amino acid transport protein